MKAGILVELVAAVWMYICTVHKMAVVHIENSMQLIRVICVGVSIARPKHAFPIY